MATSASNNAGNKGGSPGAAQEKDTVFVRNIADGVNVAELSEIFGDIGPVKHCFIVVEKEGPNKGKSKHFGFVQFALEDDAKDAIQQLNGKVVGGKSLILEAAAKRGYRPSIQKVKANRNDSRKRQRSGSFRRSESIFAQLSKKAKVLGLAESDADVRKKEELLRDCSVLFFGVSSSMTRGQLKKKLSKVGKINTIEFPLKSVDLLGGTPQVDLNESICLCIYTKQASAAQAVKKLSDKIWNGSTVQARRVKQVAVAAKSRTRCRLIVRNLPFKLKRDELKSRFEKFGPVLEVTLDMDATGKRHKGFGFVQYACRGDAQKAVKGLNGQLFKKRPIAVDFAVASTVYKKLMQGEEAGNQGTAKKGDEGVKSANPDVQVDGAKLDEEEEEGVEESEDSEDNEDNEDTESLLKQGVAESKQTVDKSDELKRTLFVRNLHFDTGDGDVLDKFREFGAVRYVKIVKDQQGKSKGTAFVQFYKKQGYDRALEASQSGGTLTAREIRLRQKLKPSERKAAALVGGNGIMLQGRPVVVKPAVDRSEAKALQEQGRQVEKTDRRHLYLAREGLIQAGDDKMLNIPKDDLNKRQSAEREKKTKLKSPLFFVSPTRLSVRNLNRRDKDESGNYVDDAVLRKAFRKAAMFGMKNKLVGANEGDPNLFPPTWPDQKKMPPVVITQARVLYEEPPLGSDAKRGRSKGFAFVEFTQHAHALACLRIVNNNPDYAFLASGGQSAMSRPVEQRPRLIVEFAVENAAKLRERQRKVDMARRRNEMNLRRARLEAAHGLQQATEAAGKHAKDAPAHDASNTKEKIERKKQKKRKRPEKETSAETNPAEVGSTARTFAKTKKHPKKPAHLSATNSKSTAGKEAPRKPLRHATQRDQAGKDRRTADNKQTRSEPSKKRQRKSQSGNVKAPVDKFESLLSNYKAVFVPSKDSAKKTNRWFD